MKRFVQGEARSQMSLLPECLDDYVSDKNPVRGAKDFLVLLDKILNEDDIRMRNEMVPYVLRSASFIQISNATSERGPPH